MKRFLTILLLTISITAFSQNRAVLRAVEISRQQATPTGSPIDLASLYIKLTPESIDASAVSEDDPIGEWTDLANGYDATSATNQPQLHIEGGERQVDFVKANTDFLSIPHANTNFIPGTDTFTIIVKIADFRDQRYPFMKGQINIASSGQYGMELYSTYAYFVIGGTRHYYDTTYVADEDIYFMVVRDDGMDVYKNNAKILDNVSVGTNTTTNDLILGASYLGATQNFDGALSYFLMYNDELTPSELTDIYNYID